MIGLSSSSRWHRQSQRQPRPHGGVSARRRYVRPYPAWGGDSVRYALRLPRETCTDEGGDTWPCVGAWWNPAAQPRERPAFAIAADGAVRRVPDRPELVLAHKAAPPVLSSCAITTARDHNNNSRHHRRSSSPVASPTTRPSRPIDGASPSSTTNGRRDLGAISARSGPDVWDRVRALAAAAQARYLNNPSRAERYLDGAKRRRAPEASEDAEENAESPNAEPHHAEFRGRPDDGSPRSDERPRRPRLPVVAMPRRQRMDDAA